MKSRRDGANTSEIVLGRLYTDSRLSIRKLSQETGVSYSKVSKSLKELQKRFGVHYTVDLGVEQLGFGEDRLICVSFGDKPDPEKLRSFLRTRPLVQNAYAAYGDYDLVMHVVAPKKSDYLRFEFKTKVELGRHRPTFEVATINDYVEGFLPATNDLLDIGSGISGDEKTLLSIMLKNSRLRLKDLVKKTGFSAIKIIYMIRRLEKRGVINRFSCTVQRPEKKVFMFYTATSTYVPEHKPKLQADFIRRVISGEEHGNLTSDYSVVCDTSGHFDSALFCNFDDATAVGERGPSLMRRCWAVENPVIKSCMLTEVLKGDWPFQKNGYVKWRSVLNGIQKKPMKFEMLE